MDNVTHTLIGTLLGEAAARTALPTANRRQATFRRTMFLSVMIVGSNLPDCDVLYSLGSDDKLPYLLEHRGHTHTVIGALVASAAMAIACALWTRRSGVPLSRPDRLRLAALALLAPLLHVAMDGLNTYGVHPWWPIDNRWFYGDSVFIVEPLFWASAAPLAFLLRSRLARGLVVLSLVAAVYLAFVSGVVAPGSIAAYGVLAMAMLAVGRYAKPMLALGAALGIALVVTAAYTVGHRHALALVEAEGVAPLAGWRTLDRVLTPLPMSPLCWEAILVQANGDRYAVRRASLSLAPWIRCRTLIGRPLTAPMQDVALPDTRRLRWRGEIVASRDRLRRLVASSCEASAFMRFARAPWFVDSGERRMIGDLRFDREPELGFAELDLARARRCPAYVPPWIPPRTDLLEP